MLISFSFCTFAHQNVRFIGPIKAYTDGTTIKQKGRNSAMKKLHTLLGVIRAVLDVAVVVLSIITIRHILTDRKAK